MERKECNDVRKNSGNVIVGVANILNSCNFWLGALAIYALGCSYLLWDNDSLAYRAARDQGAYVKVFANDQEMALKGPMCSSVIKGK